MTAIKKQNDRTWSARTEERIKSFSPEELAKYVHVRELLKKSTDQQNKGRFDIWPEHGAYEKGWIQAAKWADRTDLIADIGSPAYLKDKAEQDISE